MKKLYTLPWAVVLGMLCLLLPHYARATHMMGADMSWKCIGHDSFLFTVTVYRDCNGIDLSPTPFEITPKCGSAKTTITGVTMSKAKDITPGCKNKCNRCNDRGCSYEFGIEQYTMSAIIYLGGQNCCEFTVGWEQSARNSKISTGAAGLNFYSESTINICVKPCDNSPYFTNPPIAIVCRGDCILLNPGANDDDKNGRGEGDSLSYAFAEPLSGHNQPITYSSGYKYDQPLLYEGYPDRTVDYNPPKCKGFNLDSVTGDITFKATKEDITVMAVTVTEWRKDSTGKPVAIGQVRRDMQISIVDCKDNHSPIVYSENNQKKFDFCAGRTKCIKFNSFDLDQPDSVRMSWNSQLASLGGTFTVTNKGAKYESGLFCWTPKKSDVRSLAYQFTVEVIDNRCDVPPGRSQKGIQIIVNPAPEVTYSAILDSCGWVKFSAFRTGKEDGTYTYIWSGDGARRPNGTTDRLFYIGNAFNYKYTAGGVYHYSLTVTNAKTGCASVYTDSIIIKNYIGVDLPRDTVVCQGTSLTIQATRRGGKGTATYLWNTGSKTDNTVATVNRDSVFVVNIWDATGCYNYDSMKVKAQKPPRPKLGPDRRACDGDSVWLSPNLKGLKTIGWAKLSPAGPLSLGWADKYAAIDSGDYVVDVVDSIGCTGSDTVKVRFNPMVRVLKQSRDACRFDPITLDGGIGGAGTTWEWYDLTRPSTKPVATTKTYTIASVIGDKYYKVIAKQTIKGLTCTSVDTVSLLTHIKPVPAMRKLPAQCFGNSPLDLSVYGDIPVGGKGIWYNPANPHAIINNILYIDQLKVTDTNHLVYTVYDKFGCKASAVALIEIDTLPKVYAGKDLLLCSSDSFYLLKGIPKGGTWKGQGVHNGNTAFAYFSPGDINDAGPVQLIYSYESKTTAKCNSSDTMFIKVLPTPSPKAGSYGPYCQDSSRSVKVFLNNGLPQGGVWSTDPKQKLPATALTFENASNSFVFDPNEAGSGKFRLVYTATADGVHCAVSDTTQVQVYPQPQFSLSAGPKTSFCINDEAAKIITQPVGNVSLSIDDNKTGGKGLFGTFFDPQSAGPGMHKIRAVYTSSSTGCKSTKEISLRVDPKAIATIKSDKGFCEAASYALQGDTMNATWLKWYSPDGQISGNTSKNIVFTPDTARIKQNGGRFRISLLAGNNGACSDTTVSKEFIIYANPKITFNVDKQKGCAPLDIAFNSNSTVSHSAIEYYVWDFGDGSKDSTELDAVTHSYKRAGIYPVSLKAISLKGGCSSTLKKSDYITVNPLPIVDFTAAPTYTTIDMPKVQFISYDGNNKPLSLNVDDNANYEWNFGDPASAGSNASNEHNPVHIYGDTGKYTVSLAITNIFGCKDKIIRQNYIDIRPEVIVFIPNVFKPGGHTISPVNEKFAVVVNACASFEMGIFNRWGEQMFYTRDKQAGWDGNYHNQPTEEGVYVYIVKVTSLAGKQYTYTGTITLLR